MSRSRPTLASDLASPEASRLDDWPALVDRAVAQHGTPLSITRWPEVDAAARFLEQMSQPPATVRCWLSVKTHPLPHLIREWLRFGRGVEVVSERELLMALQIGASADSLVVNGVAKHHWLAPHSIPRLQVHFDSPAEIAALLPLAVTDHWRVGVRLHAPDERDAREPDYGGQFGMTPREAVGALRTLRDAGADIQSLHFHLGQASQLPGAYVRAVDAAADVCDQAQLRPRVLDCGGGLPTGNTAAAQVEGLQAAICRAYDRLAPDLVEIWLEHGRFVTSSAAVLAVRVLDIKHREDSRYLICDGGRTNHALAADHGLHQIVVRPHRSGLPQPTTVCGPTCMTDDRLGRVTLPSDIAVGDVLVWMDAGAYHLPWETRFSHGLSAVAFEDADGVLSLARQRERPQDGASLWRL